MVWDEIFGDVELTKVETELTAAPEFNKIKGITQLGLVYLAPQFSSAQHTRYDHSIGVLHLANKAGAHLSLSKDQLTALRLAALLHDVGHGPFSHFSEKILGWLGLNIKHEEISAKIVRTSPNINRIWKKRRSELPDKNLIADIISKRPIENAAILSKILSNDIDVDRIDYLLRDLKFTGLGYSLNCDRLIQGLTSIKINNKKVIDTAIKEDYIADANSLLLSRILLRQHVYYEPIHRAAEVLIFNCLKETMERGGPSRFNNIDAKELQNKLFEMDDSALLYELMSASSKNQKLITEIKQGKFYDFSMTLKWRQVSPYLQDKVIESEKRSKPLEENLKLCNEIRGELSDHLSMDLDEIFVDIPELERLEEASMKVFTTRKEIIRLEDFSAIARSLKDAYREVWSLLVFIRSENAKKLDFNKMRKKINSYFSEYR